MITPHVFASSRDATTAAGNFLSQHLVHKPLLLLLSGGSALSILEFTDTCLLESDITIGVVDERFSLDPGASNAGALEGTVFAQIARERHCQFLSFPVAPDDTMEYFTIKYEESLRKWQRQHKTGQIVVTLGIGADGHTAGIMPYPEDTKTFANLFDDPDHWVVGYEYGAKNEYPKRVTVTLPFLRSIDAAIVYVCGREKERALTNALRQQGKLVQTPARIILQMGQVDLFTDINTSG